ncbi:MAG: FtsH protease activity modulator HflK, partial [Rhodospirillaceae bacterium]|nr:FtsH protease activity modulator HflK [Rhodospirillaceae bacterium]
GGGGPWGGGQGPWGRGPSGQRPPNFEDMLRRGQDRFRRFLPGGFGSGRSLVLVGLAALVLWLLSGVYQVGPDEQGVELVFGKWTGTTGPGLHFNWPAPIGSVLTPRVTTTNQVEIGLRRTGTTSREVPEESLMLTGDQNIIDVQFVVFWRISDAGKFLFNIDHPEDTVHNVAEAAMREIIGQTGFEHARSGPGRLEVQRRVIDLIRDVLDDYGAGIEVTGVELQPLSPPTATIEAFRDVQAAANEKIQKINLAQAYYNEVTQRAEGEAQQIIKQAEAYKQQKIAIATGDAQRFLSVYEQYARNPDLTTRRIYLETMEDVLGGMDKVLIDTRAGAVPYLPLDELLRRHQGAPAGAGTGQQQPSPQTPHAEPGQ